MCNAKLVKAASICDKYQDWVNIGTNQLVLDWVKNGVKIPFNSIPNNYCEYNRPSTQKHLEFVSQELINLQKTGAISQVNTKPQVISPLHCVPKKGNKLRLILDLRWLNQHITAPKFTNEGINVACDLIQTGDRLAKLDLRDGFHHLKIHKDFRTYLGFQWQGRYYVYNVLVFGLNISPWCFYKLLRPVVEHCRDNGLRLVLNVDDCLLLCEPASFDRTLQFVVNLFHSLGLHINYEKSVLVGQTSIEFIGYCLFSTSSTGYPVLKIPGKRIHKLKQDIKRAFQKETITARKLAKLAGQCIAMVRVILPGKLLLRSVYRLLSTKKSWEDVLTFDQATLRELTWWRESVSKWNTQQIHLGPLDCQMTCNTSGTGWGAQFGEKHASGVWNTRLSQSHTNYRELMAILLTLKSFKDELINKHVQIFI